MAARLARSHGATGFGVVVKLIVRDVPPRAAWALEQAGVHPLLARLFAARGISNKAELDEGLAQLLAPTELKGIEVAAT